MWALPALAATLLGAQTKALHIIEFNSWQVS